MIANSMTIEEGSLLAAYCRKSREDLLRLERFTNLQDKLDSIIFLLRLPGGDFVDASRSAQRMLGYSREELLQKSIFDLIPSDVPTTLAEFFSQGRIGKEEEREATVSTILRRRDGAYLPADITLRLVSTPECVYAIAVARDVAEHQRALEALKESEERHRTLVESSSDAILTMDENWRIVSCNQAFLDLFRYGKAGLVEEESLRILHPSEESFRAFAQMALPAMETSGSFRTEWKLKRLDGSIFPVEQTVSAIRDVNGSIKGYVAIIRDITRRKQAEDEVMRHRDHLEEMVRERTHDLEAAQKALVQKEKLKTLGAVSAEVAHEIRNPLVVIGGFARRLQKKYPDTPEVEIILHESHRLEKILHRIKEYLRPLEIRLQECSVNNIVSDSLGLLADEMAQEHIAWHLDSSPDISPAYADPGMLTQIVINLVRNAVGIMDKSGVLSIRTYESERGIHIDFRSPLLAPRIKDPEFLFLPFNDSGQSIGVPFCYRLLKEMGGFLSFTQEQNYILFTVSLPKARGLDPSDPKETVRKT